VKRSIAVAFLGVMCIGSNAVIAQDFAQLGPETQTRIEVLQPFIHEASRRFPIPETWIRAVMAAESGGRIELDGKPITSSAGAMGPMQVMPETYEEMRWRYGLGPDPYDPENNILAGTAYLAELYSRFGYTGMLAAYNAGPTRYQQFLDSGRPLPEETEAYLAALQVEPHQGKSPSHGSGESLFFQLKDQALRPPETRPEVKDGALFIPLDR